MVWAAGGRGAVKPSSPDPEPTRNAVMGVAPPAPRHWLPAWALAALTAAWEETPCNRPGARSGVRELMTPVPRPGARAHGPRNAGVLGAKMGLRRPLYECGV